MTSRLEIRIATDGQYLSTCGGISRIGAHAHPAQRQEWFEQEIRWEELRPKIVELYIAKFSEPELKDLTAFYQSPTGKKALSQMPTIMQESAAIGQSYAASKQATLNAKLQPIMEKYRSQVQSQGQPAAPAPSQPATQPK